MNITKVAIPVFGTQVSPRCDCAREMLFLEFENGEIVSRRKFSMEGMNSLQRVRTISAAGVKTLICDAVPGFFRRMIEANGIRIMHPEGVEIDALIERLKQGEFDLIVSSIHRGRGKCRRDGCPWKENSV